MRRLFPALALMLALPAHAEDVLDWTPPGSAAVFVFRGSGAVSGLLDAAEKRFGDVPRISAAVKRLRAWKVGGVQPGKADFGAALSLDRGLGVFVIGERQVRVVFGTIDVKAATRHLAALAAPLKIPLRADDKGMQAGEIALSCAQRGQYAVCDTGEVPAKAPGVPPWLDGKRAPTDGVFFGVVRAALFAMMGDKRNPVNEVWAGAKMDGERFVVSAEVVANPLMMAPFAMLLAEGPATAGLDTVDARSSGVLKVAFDGPKMLNAIDALARREVERMPPPIRTVWDALRAAWSGEVVISFPGGFFHPVIVVGLQDEGAGRKLLGALVAATEGVREVGLKLGKTDTPGVERVEVALNLEGEGPKTHLGFPFAVHQKRLVLGLHAVDVQRVVTGKVQRAELPKAFAERGTHGFVAWDALGMLMAASDFEMWAEGDAQLIIDAQTIAMLGASLLEELGGSIKFTETGGRARLWWSWL